MLVALAVLAIGMRPDIDRVRATALQVSRGRASDAMRTNRRAGFVPRG